MVQHNTNSVYSVNQSSQTDNLNIEDKVTHTESENRRLEQPSLKLKERT